MTSPPTFKPADIELVPDAWNRFERAVDTVSKSGPQHKKSRSTIKLGTDNFHAKQGGEEDDEARVGEEERAKDDRQEGDA